MAQIHSTRQLAKRLLPCGLHTGLLLLGVGLLTEFVDGEEAAGVYRQIAASPDPFELVTSYYAYAANAPYPWLTGALHGLTDHVLANSADSGEKIAKAAARLVDVDICASAEYAGGELLGPVRVELETRILGVAPALAYLELSTAIPQAVMDLLRILEPGKALGTMVDGWCGSGVRVVAMAIVLDSLGYDPASAHWHLRDPDPVNIAVAAINCRAAQLPDCSFEVAPGIFNKVGFTGALSPDEWREVGGAYVSETMTERDFVALKAQAEIDAIAATQLSDQQAVTAIVRAALTEGANLS